MVNNAKVQSSSDGLAFLRQAFSHEQAMLQAKINAAHATITHDGTMGAVFESHWVSEFLERYLPNRYSVSSGIVIDSVGSTSDQIDIVVFDNQYTPTLLSQGAHKFIPAESVYAVLEVKPKIDKARLEYAGDKAASVRRLNRTTTGIRHAGGTFPPKPLHNIVAGIVAGSSIDISTLKPHLVNLAEDPLTTIDCGCGLEGGSFDIFAYDRVFEHDAPLDISKFDNNLRHRAGENTLIYFMFRFLGRLQAIGTAPAVDWTRYGEVFDEGN